MWEESFLPLPLVIQFSQQEPDCRSFQKGLCCLMWGEVWRTFKIILITCRTLSQSPTNISLEYSLVLPNTLTHSKSVLILVQKVQEASYRFILSQKVWILTTRKFPSFIHFLILHFLKTYSKMCWEYSSSSPLHYKVCIFIICNIHIII